jgi:hypothetical protein
MLHTFHGHPLKHLSFCVPTNFPVKELSTCSQPERAKQFLAETNQYKTTLQSLWHMEFCKPTSKRNKDNISHRASRHSNSSAKHRLTSQTTWWHLSHFYAWRVSHKHHEASQLASCLRTVYRSPHATEEILSLACIFQEGGGSLGSSSTEPPSATVSSRPLDRYSEAFLAHGSRNISGFSGSLDHRPLQ